MRTTPATSAFELLINSYLRMHRRSITEDIFIRKAIALIDEKLKNYDGSGKINIVTRYDNHLTKAVQGYLDSTAEPNERQLEAMKLKLQRFIRVAATTTTTTTVAPTTTTTTTVA